MFRCTSEDGKNKRNIALKLRTHTQTYTPASQWQKVKINEKYDANRQKKIIKHFKHRANAWHWKSIHPHLNGVLFILSHLNSSFSLIVRFSLSVSFLFLPLSLAFHFTHTVLLLSHSSFSFSLSHSHFHSFFFSLLILSNLMFYVYHYCTKQSHLSIK